MTVPPELSFPNTHQYCSGTNQCQCRWENKCKCINTKRIAIRCWYIFIFRCRRANCKRCRGFLCFHGNWGFCTHNAFFLGVAVHIDVEVNFYTCCAMFKKKKKEENKKKRQMLILFLHLYICLHCGFSDRLIDHKLIDGVLWKKSPLCSN